MEDENLKDEILEDENLKDEILKDESWKDENLKMILSIEKLDRYGRVTEYIPEPTESTLSKGNRMTDCMKTERPTSEYSKGGPSSRGSRISGRLRVTMQDGESFTISERQALRLGLESGAGMTQDVYEEMPVKWRDILDACAAECGEWEQTMCADDEAVQIEKMKTEAGVTWNEVDIDAFTEACAPVYDWIVEEYGATPELHQQLVDLINGFRAEKAAA